MTGPPGAEGVRPAAPPARSRPWSAAHWTHLSQAAARGGRFTPNLGGHSILGVWTEHNDWFRAVLVAWLPIAVAATVLTGTS